MTAYELRKKLAEMPADTVIYMYQSGGFSPIDCIRPFPEDEEAVILPMAVPSPKRPK